MTPIRVAVVCDLAEEGWPSMDLVAEMLLERLQTDYPDAVQATSLRPSMRRRFSRDSDAHPESSRARRAAFTLDRALNRMWDYPRELRRRRADFDVFHIVDHSYAQLVHELPAERTVVTCHDLDTFRSVLDPGSEDRSMPFRLMTRRILGGFRKAAVIVCVSEATRAELLAADIVDPKRVRVVPNGVHTACVPEADAAADAELEAILGAASSAAPELLHVGSTVPRKRIDFLLRIVAEVRKSIPEVRLVRVGGELTPEQDRLLDELGLRGSVVQLQTLSRRELAAAYRRAAVVLQPSAREGFGLPVAEALACGTPVVATDLEVLREVGGDAASYCDLDDLSGWARTVVEIVTEAANDVPSSTLRRRAAIERGQRFSWDANARSMVLIYNELVSS